MKIDKLVGERFKERPVDCVIDSQALMVRGGYVKYVSNGIYSSYTTLRRVMRKIENILREEMDAAGGQEVSFPVVLPASLWRESGRYESVGVELARFADRGGNPMIIAMTHEEAAVHLVREYGISYTRYPFMIYQIQTKYRGEARPRGGLVRAREFIMKDGYSFHTNETCLDEYYDLCLKAYKRIFARAGLENIVAVAGDSGMMGGSKSHEFMLPCPAGEDFIVNCPECGYRANMEAAENIIGDYANAPEEPLTEVHTPGAKTIGEVCAFLNLPVKQSCKAVIYQKASGGYVIVFIRGDLEANETKITNYLNEKIFPGEVTEESGIFAGFVGPYNFAGAEALFDSSLKGAKNLCCGANKDNYHFTGLNMERDCANAVYGDFAKAFEGGICPACGKHSLTISKGLELGHIFQLGTKYTESMNMQYMDENGEYRHPLMGCYGIGVGRLAAAICEAHHDEYGPIWPIGVAPWEVHLCCMRADDANVKAVADDIYDEMQKCNIEVIYDDRVVSAGVMFSDADLLGVPVRVIASPRNLKEGVCEITTRDKTVNIKVKTENVINEIKRVIDELKQQ